MKYLITESQLNLIESYSDVPLWIRRRANKETLKKYISVGEIQYPMLCDDFEDAYEYADQVIDYALDEFLSDIYGDIDSEDYYSNVMDYLRELCRNLFGEYLIKIYDETCIEES